MTFVHTTQTLILASSSPRRRDLLREIRAHFEVVLPTIEEASVNGESPEDLVCRLARDKADEVAALHPNRWVLAADTIVVIDGKILGKPADPREAEAMLTTLSARTHVVYTGYAILRSDRPESARVRFVTSQVHIRDMSPAEISDYVATREPMDKAGAYAIQGIGAGIVEWVSGSYTNVVGLPLCEVARDLKELGIFDFLAEANDRAQSRDNSTTHR
ncbi:MAG: Maf family protein [Thermodesulfobacteriota bacterium]